jgi:DNA-binding transcriptional MerR regulator
MQRAGNRRYYRPADVELARRIHRLLGQEGYTVRGVQKLLRERGGAEPVSPMPATIAPDPQPATHEAGDDGAGGVDIFRLIALRDRLTAALDS